MPRANPELTREEGTNLQIKASILDGNKAKKREVKIKRVPRAHSSCFLHFFPLVSRVLNVLLKPIKNLTTCKLQNQPLGLCNRSFELLVQDPKYIFNRNIFTGRAVMRVDAHLEDFLQFAHDLYHLHVIKP